MATHYTQKLQDENSNEPQHNRISEHSFIRLSHNEHSNDHRDKFNSYLQYILSVLGFAAGFGSLWRFPYLVFKNGGGTFLIPYFFLFFTIAMPLFYLETAIGQVFRKGSNLLYGMYHQKFKGFGVFQILLCLNMSTYYNLILAYSIYFLYESFTFPLPWTLQEDSPLPWNKDYFYRDILQSTDSINDLGHVVWSIMFAYALSQLIVFLCIQKGVELSGQIALVTATSPFILLFVLMLRGLLLDGAFDGIYYLFSPDFDKIFEKQVWVDAAVQVVFQYSCGVGVLFFFGSYRNKDQPVVESSIIVPVLTCLCGFLSAIVVFSYMGNMSFVSGIPLSEIPLSGPSLTFIVFPAVLTSMPFSNLWAIIFFLVLFFLGIDTQFAFMDGVAGCIEDEFRIGKGMVRIFGQNLSMRMVRFILCAFVACSGLLYSSQGGFYFLGFMDEYSVSINLLVGVAIETFFFTWYRSWSEDVEDRVLQCIGQPTPQIYLFLNKFWAPFITSFLAVQSFFHQVNTDWLQKSKRNSYNLNIPEPQGTKDIEFEYLKYTNMDQGQSVLNLHKALNKENEQLRK